VSYEKVIIELDKPLLRENVKIREGRFSYIEGHHAIREANRIFGFDGWGHSIDSFEMVDCGKNAKGNIVMSAQAIVTVTAIGKVSTDIGYGSGIAKSLDAAREGAGKEAVTDALKRALRVFGDPFGNALYDKVQANVVDAHFLSDSDILQLFKDSKTVDDLRKVWPKLSQEQAVSLKPNLEKRINEIESAL
jgi:DNA recombination protein Rad52